MNDEKLETVSENSDRLEYELFKKTVGFVSETATIGNNYLRKLLYVSLITGLVLSFLLYGWFDTADLKMAGAALVAFVPALFIVFLRWRLANVEALPEEIESLEGAAKNISEKLREFDVKDSLELFLVSDKISFRQRIKMLGGIVPMLYRFQNDISDVMKPEIVITLISVANPLFGLMLAFAIVPVLLWIGITLVVAVLSLLF